jgi:hypothetical protein
MSSKCSNQENRYGHIVFRPSMTLKGKRSFFRTGSATVIVGVLLNFFGFIYTTKYPSSMYYAQDTYWTNTLNLIGIGLVLIGLVVIITGSLRER